MTAKTLLSADWPQPANVGTLVTTRSGGMSTGAYASMNLALHVGDNPSHVAHNRNLLPELAGLNAADYQWQWMEQVHGIHVESLDTPVASEPLINPAKTTPKANQVYPTDKPLTADGLCTSRSGLICCVLTADCLPILLCNTAGTEIGVAHGGWRGLAGGILTNLVRSMRSEPTNLMAWLGPAIGPRAYEVGTEVLAQFLLSDLGDDAKAHFKPVAADKFKLDLYGIAKSQLSLLGVTQVYGGNFCTYHDSDRFFSHRRDGTTGRMLTACYLKPRPNRAHPC